MTRALSMLRIVQGAMLASIVLYVAVGQLVPPMVRALDPAMSYLFATLGVAVVGVIFVVRRTLVFRAESSLAAQPEDSLSLNQWRTGFIATYALCEALALFGLILKFMGGGLQASVPYYLGGFILLFFFRPHQPEAEATT
jgi:F0F1-type ATP synthase membrane subunit c/vacuolar-type H+-ATPase subunit K